MDSGKTLTKVIFKKAHYDKGETEIVAFLPTEPANPGFISCYAHVGQHSEASYEFYRDCRPCTRSESAKLRKEMEDLFGYRFVLAQRITESDRRIACRHDRPADPRPSDHELLYELADAVLSYDRRSDAYICALQRQLEKAGVDYEKVGRLDRMHMARDEEFCKVREILRVVKNDPHLLEC